ncbi:HAD family phosphatase [Kutzneria sp. CA-103260]|nr:HAD family phosphatase [Kutzneria sp. CA-103260]
MSGSVEAVVFDLDGTVVDTPDLIGRIIGVTAGELGYSVAPAVVRSTIGTPLVVSFAQLFGLPADDRRVAAAVAAYRARFDVQVVEHGSKLPFRGVVDGLAVLRARGLALAVATSRILASARLVLDASGLAGAFDAVVGYDEVANGKPAADTALLAARRLGVAPGRCQVVGDAVGDMLMGVRAGMRTLGVSYGVGGVDDLTAAGARRVVGDFPSVVADVLPGDSERHSP